ncbi:uncharacterized protein [Leptinotarsa decemlineata]|uniref:uncharacterized protein n=1 Tax=Leptinotarsa decemlineata TaxID=7539 RepID=UPI003D30C8BE
MMKIVLAFVAVLGIASAAPGFFSDTFGEAAKTVAEGASHFTQTAVDFAHGAAHAVSEGASGFANVLFGFRQNGKAGYASLFQYYENLGIHYFPDFGCCSCPPPSAVQPDFPNYSPNSPFYINGVFKVDNTEFCTCPPELVASVVQAAHHNPGLLGNIAKYVSAIPQFGNQIVRNAGNAFTHV